MSDQQNIINYKVFVGGLSNNVNRSMLRNAFRKFGNIEDSTVVKEKRSGKPKGYGFLTFRNQTSYEKALNAEVFIDGLLADVQPLKSKENLQNMKKMDQRLKVFVGGLHHTVTSRELKKYFEKFGEIKDARVLYDGKTKMSRGFGFILFRKEKDLQNALNTRNTLKGKRMDCKRFEQSFNTKQSSQGKSNTVIEMERMKTDASLNSHSNSNKSRLDLTAVLPGLFTTLLQPQHLEIPKQIGKRHIFCQIGELERKFSLNLNYPIAPF